jgi:WD40 repeat protein
MKPYLILGFVVMLGLTSCQTTDRPLPSETATSIPPVPSTRTAPTPTSTAIATVTPLPTLTPAPTATPLLVASRMEKGLLLIWDDRVKQYEVLDLNTGNPPRTIQWNSECEWDLLPRATTTVCEHRSGRRYLFDILKGTIQDLPVWNAKLTGWDPNGRFLVFTQGAEDDLDIFTYDITTNVTHTLTLHIDQQEQAHWLTRPALSADGQVLIVVGGTSDHPSPSVFEIAKRGSEFRQIGLTEPPATWDVAWSPTAHQFVYGATDIKQEIGPSPNYLYLVDMPTAKVRRLAKSTDPLFFWSSSLSWSPTGKYIAVGLSDLLFESKPQACVIDITTEEEMCLDSLPSSGGLFSVWSPSGEHIAFVDLDRKLTISEPDGTGAVQLLENIPSDFLLFWR